VADIEIRSGSTDDVDAAYAVLAACGHGTWFDFDREQLQALWPSYKRTWMAEADGLIAYAAVLDPEIEVYVLPNARRRGIGSRLLREAERAIDAPFVEATARRGEPAAAPFLAAHGYERAYETWLMQIDLEEDPPEPTWPEGIRVRTFRNEKARTLKELLDLAYAGDPRFRPDPFEDWRRFMMDNPSFEPASWFLAEAGDGSLAGAALNWKEGYVKDLVVHPAHRCQGLGEALLRHTFRQFRRRGLDRVTLKTDSLNPTQAWRLYERLGMRKSETYDVFEKRR
jgi:mycothiol synthase